MSSPQSDAGGAQPPIRLTDLGSGRLATRAFAVPTDPQRFRRPTDVVLLVLSLVILAVTASTVDDPGDFEETFADWLASLPGFLDFFWTTVHDFVQLWVLVVAVLALVRRRWGLLRDWAISIAVAIGGVLFVGWLVDGEVPTLSDSIGAADGAADFRHSRSRPAPRQSQSRARISSARCARSVGGLSRRRGSRLSYSVSRNRVPACVRSQSDGPPGRSCTCCSVRRMER